MTRTAARRDATAQGAPSTCRGFLKWQIDNCREITGNEQNECDTGKIEDIRLEFREK